MEYISIYLISDQTYEECFNIMYDIKNDPRLKGLNALVLLSLKSKGRAYENNYKPITQDQFNEIVNYSFKNNVPIGFDSCSAQKFLESVKNEPNYKQLETLTEPCEAAIYSTYINEMGVYYPCSFMEGQEEWEEGIDVLKANNFIDDVWDHPKTKEFRNKVIACRIANKSCPQFEI